MRKVLIYTILIFLIIILLKFRFSNYSIEYKVNGYDVKTVYKDKRFYNEISKDKAFNFDIYMKRGFKYTKITDIKEITDENLYCIYPVIKDVKTYPLCYYNDEYTDYNLIDSDLLSEYKKESINDEKPDKDFTYYNNLEDNEYIALWNYKGYIVMHDGTFKNVDLFKNDKYDNTLSYLLNGTIYMANNDEEHEFTSLVKFDLVSLKHEVIKLDYTIDFDSYIVGNVKKNIYIFDNKHAVLYEFNTKNNKIKVVSDNAMGYIKYENGEFVNCSKAEYRVNKIKYNNNSSNYTYSFNNGFYKKINDNNDLIQKINNEEIKYIYEDKNNMYYLFDDSFYRYSPLNGNDKIFYNYELTFNSDNTIFVYIK